VFGNVLPDVIGTHEAIRIPVYQSCISFCDEWRREWS
jgi:hypothetical protein